MSEIIMLRARVPRSRGIMPLVVVLYGLLLILLSLSSILQEAKARNSVAENTHLFEQRDSRIIENLSSIGGWFTENKGQIKNSDIRFVYAASGCSIGFAKSGYLIKLCREDDRTAVVRVNFENSNQVAPEGREKQPHYSNYFIEDEPSKWRTRVPTYRNVVYNELYDSIDLMFFITERGLKYDFVLSPGAEPEVIRYTYYGADDVSIDSRGGLHITTPSGELIEEAPFSYQMIDGKKVTVSSRYWTDGKMVGFKIGTYDPTTELIIDPLLYSTFIGGSDSDWGQSITLDSENNAYVTGTTGSSDFPTTPGCFDDSHNSDEDVYVFKLNSDGTELLYSTFVGGSSLDSGESIVLDSERNAYVTGMTESSDFPTTFGSFDPFHNGEEDVFVFKLNSDGTALLYSTYVGGEDRDNGFGIALDAEKNAYVTGETGSSDFPTTYSFHKGGLLDVFVFKLSSDGSYLVYSTLVGGESLDYGYDIVLDTETNAYVTGQTKSSDFPTTPGCLDDSYNGGFNDVFIFKLDSYGLELVYSTFVGGDDYERGESIVLDSETNAYVTGVTNSTDFPTTSGCFDDSINEGWDVFVLKLNSAGSDLNYSTFVGGSGVDRGEGITLDSENNAYVTGRTSSFDFPTTSGCFDNSYGGWIDVFIVMLDSRGSDLSYSTFIEDGSGHDIVLDSENNPCVTGDTWSSDFPTTFGCFDDSYNGEWEIFVFALNMKPTRPVAHIDSIIPSPGLNTNNIHFRGHGEGDNIGRYVWRSSINEEFYNGTNGEFNYVGFSIGEHVISFKVQSNCGTWSEEVSETLIIHKRPVAQIHTISPNPSLVDENVLFTAIGTDDDEVERYLWSSSIDGELYNGTADEFILSNLSVENHIIFLQVMDSYHVWSTEVSAPLVIHLRPTVTIALVSPNPAFDTDIVFFRGNATDDGGIIRYVWFSSLDEELYNGSEAEFDFQYLSTGTHTISLRVQDNYGVWSDETSTPLTVTNHILPNEIPSVTITEPEDGASVKGKITFRGTAYDEDGSVEKVELSINGAPWDVVQGTQPWTFEWDTNELQNGEYTIMARSYDGLDYSDEDVVAVTVENEDDGNGGFVSGFQLAEIVGIIGLMIYLSWKKKGERR